MFQTIFGAVVGSIIGLIVYIYVFYLIYLFFKSARVNYFQYDEIDYPSFFWGSIDEKLVVHAHSVSGRFKFYLSNKRVLFSRRNLIATKHSCKSMPLSTVNTSEVYYANPYWLLILAALEILFFVFGVISAVGSSSNDDDELSLFKSKPDDTPVILLLIGLIIFVIILIGLWYYFRGYQIVIKNASTSFHILCRDRKRLLDLMHKLDIFRLSLENTPEIQSVYEPEGSNQRERADELQSKIERYSDKFETALKTKLHAGKQRLHDMTAPDKGMHSKGGVTYDQTCSKCQSVITLELEDLRFNTFVCPICSAVNTINKKES